MPCIWWCQTGPFTSLPLHAAGLYNESDPGFKVSDFVISSYTPTLNALLEVLHVTPQEFKGLLVVSQLCTPGQAKLPNAARELTLIKEIGSGITVHSLPDDSATVERVLGDMETHSSVHFAFHAEQNTSKPIQSAFYLQDGNLTLSRIITKSFPHADFAFLSAYQTATGTEYLSEEAGHLAAGMLAAGYRSVIATM